MPGWPKLLFISPTYPDVTGGGPAMRSGVVLEALSRRCDVYLLVVPLFINAPSPSAQRFVEATCSAVEAATVTGWSDTLLNRLRLRFDRAPHEYRYFAIQPPARRRPFDGVDFEAVHVFRLYAAPLAEPFLRLPRDRRPRIDLDLDDIESDTRRSIAVLRDVNGDAEGARRDRDAAGRFERLERAQLRRFDRVYVCSRADADLLVARHALSNVRVLPNAVRLPQDPASSPDGPPFRFLFVGSLGYYPNHDAIAYFCREVLPILRRRAPGAFVVDVVAEAPPDVLDLLSALPEVEAHGRVEDLAPFYARAGAVIVPIRGGGGTRIKLIEAFAQRRPVVATSFGAAGVDAVDGRHALIADTPEAFANACLRLMREPELAARLAGGASELVAERYTVDAVVRALDATP